MASPSSSGEAWLPGSPHARRSPVCARSASQSPPPAGDHGSGNTTQRGFLIGAAGPVPISGVTVKNNLIFSTDGLVSQAGVFLELDGDGNKGDAIHIHNNTFHNLPEAIGSYYTSLAEYTDLQIKNNVFSAIATRDIDIDPTRCNPVIQSNLYAATPRIFVRSFSSTTDSSPVIGDPRFVSSGAKDFHIQSTSAAIDKGATQADITYDFDGVPRPQGSAFDIGAYEYVRACASGADCTTPPTCRVATAATCSAGTCLYPPAAATVACTTGDPCATGDHCDGQGACVARTNVCAADAGAPDSGPGRDAATPGPDAGAPDAGAPDSGHGLDAATPGPDAGAPDAGACASPTLCTSLDGCKEGAIDCTGRCASLVDRPVGVACTGGVCNAGVCRPCTQGASCTSVDTCQAGTIDCSTGKPVCSGLANRADRTPCLGGGTCNAGVCSQCQEGAACLSIDGCQTGSIACSGGHAVCSTLLSRDDGTACPGGACLAGSCNVCTPGASCMADDGCGTGAIACSTGAPVCASLTSHADGTQCPGGACEGGLCRPVAVADAGASPGTPHNIGAGCGCTSAPPGGAVGPLVLAALLSARVRRQQRGTIPGIPG